MIIYHQRNMAAFVGAHRYYWLPQGLIIARYSITSAVVVVIGSPHGGGGGGPGAAYYP